MERQKGFITGQNAGLFQSSEEEGDLATQSESVKEEKNERMCHKNNLKKKI